MVQLDPVLARGVLLDSARPPQPPARQLAFPALLANTVLRSAVQLAFLAQVDTTARQQALCFVPNALPQRTLPPSAIQHASRALPVSTPSSRVVISVLPAPTVVQLDPVLAFFARLDSTLSPQRVRQRAVPALQAQPVLREQVLVQGALQANMRSHRGCVVIVQLEHMEQHQASVLACRAVLGPML